VDESVAAGQHCGSGHWLSPVQLGAVAAGSILAAAAHAAGGFDPTELLRHPLHSPLQLRGAQCTQNPHRFLPQSEQRHPGEHERAQVCVQVAAAEQSLTLVHVHDDHTLVHSERLELLDNALDHGGLRSRPQRSLALNQLHPHFSSDPRHFGGRLAAGRGGRLQGGVVREEYAHVAAHLDRVFLFLVGVNFQRRLADLALLPMGGALHRQSGHARHDRHHG